ncbi:MAG: hypothetical protein ABSD59_12285 [Terracidiphilus sp.]
MKRSILVAIFAAAFAVAACTPAALAGDEKDFPIKVHVSSSEVKAVYGGVNQYIAVLIDGKKYEWAPTSKFGVGYPIHPGDYQARLVKDEAKGNGQFDREYEILFADGKTTKYQVVGEFE